jgi:hypothetical protein
MLEVNNQDDDGWSSFKRRRKYLELDVLVQERPLPDESFWPRRRTAAIDEK